ncbi:MAG: putative rane protein [Ilumatobacteraceae bacterium]|nr:putative rane protein [Ilumatobacteraceae bacterium]
MNNPTKVLIAISGVAGAAHFASPQGFDDIVPHALPGSPRMWTYLSGVTELGVAAAVAGPRSRRAGATAAAALFVAVFPANIQMAVDWADKPVTQRLLAYGRLPLQVPLIWLALRVRRSMSPVHGDETWADCAGVGGSG